MIFPPGKGFDLYPLLYLEIMGKKKEANNDKETLTKSNEDGMVRDRVSLRKRKRKDFSDYETDFSVKSSKSCKQSSGRHQDNVTKDGILSVKSSEPEPSKDDFVSEEFDKSITNDSSGKEKETDTNSSDISGNLDVVRSEMSNDNCNERKMEVRFQTYDNDVPINVNIKSKHSKIKIVSAKVIPQVEANSQAKISEPTCSLQFEYNTSKGRPTSNINFEQKHEIKAKRNDSMTNNNVGFLKHERTDCIEMNSLSIGNDSSENLSDQTHYKKMKKLNKNDKEGLHLDDEVNVKEWFNFSNLIHVKFECMFDESCSFTSHSYTKWCQHFRSVHSKKKMSGNLAYCLKCQYTPLEKRLLKEHILVKHNDMPTCPIGLQHCGIISETTGKSIYLIACIFCGFLMDEDKFEEMHECKRIPFYFYCPMCDNKEVDFDIISSHIQVCHKDEVVFRKEVPSQYTSLRTSNKDLASRIDDHETECQTCERKFYTNTELKLHVNKVHELYPYSCGVCRLCYGRLGSVRCHMKKSHLLSHVCKYCQRRCGSKRDLKRHEATHLKIRPFKCEHCDNSYADSYALQFHSVAKHPTVWKDKKSSTNDEQKTSYMCHLCGENLQTKLLFNLHQKQKHAHNEESFPCTTCSKSFTNKRAYMNHLCDIKSEVSHSSDITYDYDTLHQTVSESCNKKGSVPEKRVNCKICKKSFQNRRSLRHHLLTLHLSSKEKKLLCSVCNKTFLTKYELKNHLKIHKDCKPYRCKICSKTFRQLGHVKDHLRFHASSSQHKCPLCVLTFKTQATLLIHVARHCTVNPFECPIGTCVSKFGTIYLLNIHLRRCEKDHENLKCKLCQEVFTDKHETIIHMKTHENEEIYDCQICHVIFNNHKKLVRHKTDSNHFTDVEIADAADTSIHNRQKFKYANSESNMQMDELLKMYEYVKHHDIEISEIGDPSSDMTYAQENVEDQNEANYNFMTDSQNEEEVENVGTVETMLENFSIRDRSSHNSRETAVVTVLQPSDDMWTEIPVGADLNTDNSVNTIEVRISDEINHSEIISQEVVCKMSSHEVVSDMMPREVVFKMAQQGVISEMMPQEVICETEPEAIVTEIVPQKATSNLISQPVSMNDCQIFYQDDITTSSLGTEITTTDNVVTLTEQKLDRRNSNTEIEIKQTESIDKTSFSVIHEGQVYVLNQDNSSDVIDGNSLNFVLPFSADGNYSIHTVDVNEDQSHDKSVDFDVSTSIEGQSESVHSDFDNEKVPQSEEREVILDTTLCDNIEVKTVQTEMPYMLSETKMNVDKVQGILTDTEAVISNQKLDENNTNYKVRLCYYDDRSKRMNEYPLKCDQCDKRYKRKKDLNQHKKVHIPNEDRPFHCSDCGKGFTTMHALLNHERIHSNVKPYKCTKCDKSFRQLGHLQVHLRVHADYRPFQCAFCEKTFISNNLLNAHIRNKHNSTGEQFDCDACPSSFVSIDKLRYHKITHLGQAQKLDLLGKFSSVKAKDQLGLISSNEDLETSTQKRRKDKPVMCDICGKVVTNIKQHKSSHETNAVPCTDCSKVFASEFKLKRHKIHCHTRKYLCDVCGLKLNSYSTALKHSKTHKGEVYNCSMCNKTYISQCELIKHLVTCVGDKLMTEFNKLIN